MLIVMIQGAGLADKSAVPASREMRNLNILSWSTHTLPATHAAHITASTLDGDSDTVFAVTERVDADAQDVDICVWRANEDVLVSA
jgi:hypothetical protein